MFARPLITVVTIAAICGIAMTPSRSRAALQNDKMPVARWNTIALEALSPTEGTNPMMQSRTFAILHAAIHDALNAIHRRFEPYTPGLNADPGASVDAAVASAAREVLVALVPDQATVVNVAYASVITAIPDGSARAAGISAGEAAARATLARRKRDGHDAGSQPAYVPSSGPGAYQLTAPFTFAAQPGWGRVRPFVIDITQHNVKGPQPLTGADYAGDLEHVKAIGGIMSSTRTDEQSEIARFWYEDSPLGWNRITNTVVQQQKLDPWSAARTFALVNFAMADGFIAGFEAKYRFNFWRPVTAIQAASTDGNPSTEADTRWQPLLTTPPVPDYPSTHTVLGWAAAQVLIDLFGDDVQYSATSLTLPGVTRHYRNFSAAAEENGLSRIYAGIHFQHAVKDGKRQGRSIGRTVARSLPPVREE